jgi:hypothetical protein
MNSFLTKEGLLDAWQVSSIITKYKKGDENDCSNYHGMSLLSISYKIIFNTGIIRTVEECRLLGCDAMWLL